MYRCSKTVDIAHLCFRKRLKKDSESPWAELEHLSQFSENYTKAPAIRMYVADKGSISIIKIGITVKKLVMLRFRGGGRMMT